MPILKTLAIGALVREAVMIRFEIEDRRQIFQQAREYADSVGKPMLVVGVPKFRFNHPCGDVNIDLSAEMARFCDGEVADIRDIPYPDRYFGSAYASHVLEHLGTMDDAITALDELERVADRVFTVSPHKTSLVAWLCPEHHLWITTTGSGYIIQQRSQPAETASYLVGAAVV